MAKSETVGTLTKKLQKVFNEYIRLRDKDKPCISCGNYFDTKDAGHFYATSGYSGLRFDEDNVHGECARCNRFDESHLIGYAENLKIKIGESDYLALKQRAEDYKRFGVKWSRDELKEKIIFYQKKILELK